MIAVLAGMAGTAAAQISPLPRNCGELSSASGQWVGYLRAGGPTPGINDVLVCDRDHACNAVYAAQAGAPLAIGWRGDTLVIVSPAADRRPTAALKRLQAAPPPVEVARALPGTGPRLVFDAARCATPPPVTRSTTQ